MRVGSFAAALGLAGVLVATVGAQAAPISATFNIPGSIHISCAGNPCTVFDYGISAEMVDASLAGQHLSITSIALTGSATGTSFVVFDAEIHLSGTGTGLTAGNYDNTSIDPVTGHTRVAESQLRTVPFRNSGPASFAFSVTYDGATDTTTTSPPKLFDKELPEEELDLDDGLHAQIFLWTGSSATDVTFSNLVLTVQGEATAAPEPASLAVLGVGLAALGIARRRRRPKERPLFPACC